MTGKLEQIFKSAEHIRNLTLEFSDPQSAHLCYLFLTMSGFLFDYLRKTETKVYLQIHFSDVPELLSGLKSQGENFWILQDLVSVSLEKVKGE